MGTVSKVVLFLSFITLGLVTFFLLDSYQDLEEAQKLRAEKVKEVNELKQLIDLQEQFIHADELFISGRYDSAMAIYPEVIEKLDMSEVLRSRDHAIQKHIALMDELQRKDNEGYLRLVEMREKYDSQVGATRSEYEQRMDSALGALSEKLVNLKSQLETADQKLSRQPKHNSLVFYSKSGTRTTYFGEVLNNKANGQGVGYYSTGNAYIGPWKDNLKHGEGGKFMWLGGESYEGDYEQDRRSGQGTYYWSNGDRYTGAWSNDKQNGIGTLFDSDGNIKIKGEWKDGELIKEL